MDRIGPLWLELRQMHRATSMYFDGPLGAKTFEERREELLEKTASGLMRVELAWSEDGRLLAYCVSSIDPQSIGEVDSIFVTAGARGMGLGTRLMDGSMRWMDGLGVRRSVLSVIVGNEEVHGFYVRYGFQPKSVPLEHVPDAGVHRGSDKPI